LTQTRGRFICLAINIAGARIALARDRALSHFAYLGVVLNGEPVKRGEICRLTRADSNVSVFVIPVNEELGTARKVVDIFT